MNETSRAVLALLGVKDRTIDEMQRDFGLSQSTDALNFLRRAGLARQYRITDTNVLWFAITAKGKAKLQETVSQTGGR